MFDQHVVFLDLETTGGSALHDRIIEIGLIEIAHGRWVGEWSTLVNPGRSIPSGIQNLTGITDAMLAEAPRFEEVAATLVERLEGKVLAAHNARFDYGFLKAELERAGRRYTAPVLCTVKLARRLFPQHPRHNLDALIMRHSIFCLDRHRALGDARVLWELAQIWRHEPGEDVLNASCAELLRRPALPPALPIDLFDILPEARGVYIFYGAGNRALYVGRSANVRSRVMAHFSEGASAQDAAIAAQVERVDFLETAGELGASLEEARLKRTHAPIYNRRAAEDNDPHCTWYWRAEAPASPPELCTVDELDRLGSENVYGLFRSRAGARQALRGLCKTHELCPAVMGLDARGESGACSAHAGGRCRGACIGAEPLVRHTLRAMQALNRLRMKRWPYRGPVGIREHAQDNDRSALYLVDEWRYLGTAKSEADLHELGEISMSGSFDADVYKMLVRFLKSPGTSCDILPLERLRPINEEIT